MADNEVDVPRIPDELIREFLQLVEGVPGPWSAALERWLASRALPADVDRAVRAGVLREHARAIVARSRPKPRRRVERGRWRR